MSLMEVILTRSVENVGSNGEVVNVAAGYARNYLIPQGMAVPADGTHRRVMAEETRLFGLRDRKRRRAAEVLAGTFQDVSVTIAMQAGEDDKLFGSVTNRDIAVELAKQGREIDRHSIELEEPLKQLGVYSVPVRLHQDVRVSVKVWVVKA
jgi:large subunit ribosomal protein L9